MKILDNRKIKFSQMDKKVDMKSVFYITQLIILLIQEGNGAQEKMFEAFPLHHSMTVSSNINILAGPAYW